MKLLKRLFDLFKPVLLRSELIFADENEVMCWMEIDEGMRVRVSLPPHCVDHLNLRTGDEFMWGLYRKRAYSVRETVECERIKKELEDIENESIL